MDHQPLEPEVLEAPKPQRPTWAYPWLGLLLGMAAGVLTGHPLAMVVYNIHGHVYEGQPLDIMGAFFHSFHLHMWPMISLYTLFGGIIGLVLGLVFQRLKENRLRLDQLHQEFELQVATLRHHYKNLAVGIHGFSGRLKRKIVDLDETFRQCFDHGTCPTYEDLHPKFGSLEQHAEVLADAAQRLTHTLGQELLFLKALTSDTLTLVPRDFYPLLVHSVRELLGLRFRDKEIRVDINGYPLEECKDSMVFPFEPYTMEVILQNVMGNAMRYGDHIQIRVAPKGGNIRVEVEDNGPGLDVKKLKQHLLIPSDRREAESTHLGLRVSLHLLEKYGGRLLAWSKPEAGALFIIEVPQKLGSLSSMPSLKSMV